MGVKKFLITAAGGNGTAIEVLDAPLSREQYALRGEALRKESSHPDTEQAGFLIPSESHFEMAGGEFSGNAARAAALILAESNGVTDISFTVSGFKGLVEAQVRKDSDQYRVRTVFPGMKVERSSVELASGQYADVVDLGGIVHVALEARFPNFSTCNFLHREIVRELGLEKRDAVGVIWYERTDDKVLIHPMVWVREVDTCFYEKSCGSGTIAIGAITGSISIAQPSGQNIEVHIENDKITLESGMQQFEMT